MIRVLHLFDASARWEHRVGLAQLLDRLPGQETQQHVAVTDGLARARLGLDRRDLPLFARRFELDFVAAPALRRFLRRKRIDLIHAWGVRAAAVAEHAVSADCRPLVLTAFDPWVRDRDAGFLRTVRRPDRKAVVCPFQTVRRRLVEKGIDPARCVVIRPGVDFSLINAARRSDLRARLGLTPAHTAVLVPDPVTPTGGHFTAFWATAIRSFLDPDVRLVVPGHSREQRRLVRLARQLGMDRLVACPGPRVGFERLVAIVDLAVVTPTGDIPGTALAWAMAAGVPIIATAVYSVAEMLAHNVNSVLLKPAAPKRLAASLAGVMADRQTLRRMAEVARGQAYEVFGLRRCTDQHHRLYDNLMNDRPIDHGIPDSAQPRAAVNVI